MHSVAYCVTPSLDAEVKTGPFFFFFLLLTLFVHSQSQNENTAAPKPPLFHKEDEDEIGPEFGKSRK